MSAVLKIIRAYRNKVSHKLWGTARTPAQGRKKGDILLSYLVRPFTLAPWEHFTDPHSNYQECREIARLFVERGYAVDAINWDNTTFIPRKPYRAVIDTAKNLERLSPFLPRDCKKVMHITFSYHQNQKEQERLRDLKKRRGNALLPQRVEPPSRNPAYADFLEGFGNDTAHASFSEFGKSIYPIPISVTRQFDFPEQKNFSSARENFLFFSGGGAVMKGLDLVLEAFAGLPQYDLHIVGPATYEQEFERAYVKEFSLPNIHRYPRPRVNARGDMTVGGIPFVDIADKCAALLSPSASEGTSGAVIQAMHAGIVPAVTKETGLAEDAPAIILENPTVENIRTQAITIALSSPSALRLQAYNAWRWVRARHTMETFRAAYAHFIDEILHL